MIENNTSAARLADPMPASQLPLSPQENAIANLHETIDSLTSRLYLILGPDLSEKIKAAEAASPRMQEDDEPETSPLAAQLRSNNRGINSASNRLSRLIDRLEV